MLIDCPLVAPALDILPVPRLIWRIAKRDEFQNTAQGRRRLMPLFHRRSVCGRRRLDPHHAAGDVTTMLTFLRVSEVGNN